MDQFHLIQDHDEGRLLGEVDKTVSGRLQEHRAPVGDPMEPGGCGQWGGVSTSPTHTHKLTDPSSLNGFSKVTLH